MARLTDSECELLDAHNETPPPDDTLPARAAVVTVLMTADLKGPSDHFMAFSTRRRTLASAVAANGAHASKTVRVAFLHGRAARKYLRMRSPKTPRRATRTRPSSASLPQARESWSRSSAPSSTARRHGRMSTRSSAFAALHQRPSNGAAPTSAGCALLASLANAGDPDGAYAYHAAAISHDFWSYLHFSQPPDLAPHATQNPDFCGALSSVKLFLKLVPRKPHELPRPLRCHARHAAAPARLGAKGARLL